MAKVLSKRISERKKTQHARKLIKKAAKIRKEQRKKQKGQIKVPKSVLMTEEQKAHLENIKLATQNRTKNHKIEDKNIPEYISELEKCIFIRGCDTFVEIIDFRDIEGSRNKYAEKIIKQHEKPLYVYINYNNELFNIDLGYLEQQNLIIINDFSIFADSKKLCIFGNPKSGKFLLSKNIQNVVNEKDLQFEFVKTPITDKTVSEVLRGHIDLQDINPIVMFRSIWEDINKNALKSFYMLANFDDYEEFLKLLCEKLEDKNSLKKSISDAALYFFKDIKNQNVPWMKKDGKYYFFNQ